ncbi:MAG: polyphosphate kinase 1 [bacterium]
MKPSKPAPRRSRHKPAPGSRFLDRDLNWLEFNRRVLNEALDERTPLLERVNFLAIFTSNLDEFVMKRVYGLREQIWAGVKSPDTAGEQTSEGLLHAIHASIQEMLNRQADGYHFTIKPALAAEGIHLLGWDNLTEAEKKVAAVIFDKTVFSVLTPLSVDVGHPFPFISNLSLSLAITLNDPSTGTSAFARVKIPNTLPQWIRIETAAFKGAYRFVSLVDLIAHHLDRLFPDMKISGVMPFRVTRNAEVEADLDDVEDLLQAVEEQVRQRRMECVVRLECPREADPINRLILMEALELGEEDVYEMPGLVEYRSLRDIAALPFPAFRYKPWTPLVPSRLQAEDSKIFSVIRAGDLLVQHPYESFDDTVLRLIKEAAADPDVLAIKMTLYRTGKDSPFVPLLIQAAESGKQVACLVELKARFDEHENIVLAQKMERAGVHVVYGVEGLKTHTKTTLVVRREEGESRCYAHIGTGNYHRQTARLYVDASLLTCRAELTADIADLFNYLTGRNRKDDYRKLLIAPANMKQRFLAMIEREIEHHRAGRPAHILAKMNQLEDRDICNALYTASQAGVSVDLIVRGFCTLKPGVPGLSENIRVISVIGRFLEHSRIYHFRNGAEQEVDGEFYIGSADWMHRNLESRVEAITPIEDKDFKTDLQWILQTHLSDQRSAWDMNSDGTYIQRKPKNPDGTMGSHDLMMRQATLRHG